ncbi:hypothetical protein, partial [Limosilactobacillus fermentum]
QQTLSDDSKAPGTLFTRFNLPYTNISNPPIIGRNLVPKVEKKKMIRNSRSKDSPHADSVAGFCRR